MFARIGTRQGSRDELERWIARSRDEVKPNIRHDPALKAAYWLVDREGGKGLTAAQQRVIDGADLPIVNTFKLKIYEVSKYVSMTYHDYGPTMVVMNFDIWKSLPLEQQKLLLDVGMEAQKRVREATESVDNLQKAKALLEPKGMKVNAAGVAAFRKVAADEIWPQYQQQYAEQGDKIVNRK